MVEQVDAFLTGDHDKFAKGLHFQNKKKFSDAIHFFAFKFPTDAF
jgi:hypothetical protein